MMPPRQVTGMSAGFGVGAQDGAPPSQSDTRQHDQQEPADTNQVDDDDNEEPNVTPEEQAAYDQFVHAGFTLIYGGGKVNDNIVQMLDDDPKDLMAVLGPDVGKEFSPVIALAATATIVVLQVVRTANPKPDDDIILHGGRAILEDLANLAREGKIHDYSSEDVGQAMLHAVNLYRLTASAEGLVDNDALTQEFADILNAQEAGTLSEALPGIERYSDGGRR